MRPSAWLAQPWKKRWVGPLRELKLQSPLRLSSSGLEYGPKKRQAKRTTRPKRMQKRECPCERNSYGRLGGRGPSYPDLRTRSTILTWSGATSAKTISQWRPKMWLKYWGITGLRNTSEDISDGATSISKASTLLRVISSTESEVEMWKVLARLNWRSSSPNSSTKTSST